MHATDPQEKITCRICKLPKYPNEMRSMYGKPCRICRTCDGKGRAARYKIKPKSRARYDRINQQLRERRLNGVNLDWFIYRDTRKNDKKKNEKMT